MRVLLTGLNYSPDLIGTGKYTGELGRWLSEAGHEVRVVTAPPYYPEWRIAEGYSRWRYSRKIDAGVVVWRCPMWVPKRPTGARRLLHLASFAATNSVVMVAEAATWRPNIVIAIAPTIVCAPAALAAARLSGALSWLHVQDLELDAALGLGIVSANPAERLLRRSESVQLQHFDVVSTISDTMAARLRQKGARKVVLFPNWVDLKRILPDQDAGTRFRNRFDIPANVPVVLYAGSMGKKQGLEIVVEAACRQNDALFVLCGDGPAKAGLQALAGGRGNVRFLPLQPEERLNEMMNAATIHVLPQLPGAADLVMPSKLMAMLASGGVVVATASPESALGRAVLSAGGVVTEPEDVERLTISIRELLSDPGGRRQRALLARQYSEQHFDRDKTLSNFESRILRCVSGCSFPTVEAT